MYWWWGYLYGWKKDWMGTSYYSWLRYIKDKSYQFWQELYNGLGYDSICIQWLIWILDNICRSLSVWVALKWWTYICSSEVIKCVIIWFNIHILIFKVYILQLVILLIIIHILLLIVIWIWLNVL